MTSYGGSNSAFLAKSGAVLVGLMLTPHVGWASPSDVPAAEQPPQVRALALLDEGVELRVARRDDEALAKFQQANALYFTPEGAAQEGFAEQALGRWVDAEAHVLLALTSAEDTFVIKNRVVIDESLAKIRNHLTSIELRQVASGALVSIDGAEFLPIQLKYRLTSGAHQFQIQLEGYETKHLTLSCGGGSECRENVTLLPLPKAPVQTPPDAPLVPTDKPPPLERSATWHRPVAYSLLAAGGVGIGIGAWQWSVREREANFAQQTAVFEGGLPYCGPLTGMDDPACVAASKRARTAQTVSTISFAVGGGLVASGALLYLFAPAVLPAKKLGLHCAPGFGALTCEGAF